MRGEAESHGLNNAGVSFNGLTDTTIFSKGVIWIVANIGQ
jgi:hypothetical protein